MPGTSARASKNGPYTLVVSTWANCSGSAAHSGTSASTRPALFTSRSTEPRASSASRAAASTATRSVTSAASTTARRPSASTRSATAVSFCPSRASRATSRPAAAKAVASAAPMPREAPVTRAVRAAGTVGVVIPLVSPTSRNHTRVPWWWHGGALVVAIGPDHNHQGTLGGGQRSAVGVDLLLSRLGLAVLDHHRGGAELGGDDRSHCDQPGDQGDRDPQCADRQSAGEG